MPALKPIIYRPIRNLCKALKITEENLAHFWEMNGWIYFSVGGERMVTDKDARAAIVALEKMREEDPLLVPLSFVCKELDMPESTIARTLGVGSYHVVDKALYVTKDDYRSIGGLILIKQEKKESLNLDMLEAEDF